MSDIFMLEALHPSMIQCLLIMRVALKGNKAIYFALLVQLILVVVPIAKLENLVIVVV